MTNEEIKKTLDGVHVRLQKSGSENSGIPEHEWRIKYRDDVSKLKGIIENLLELQELSDEDDDSGPKNKRSKK